MVKELQWKLGSSFNLTRNVASKIYEFPKSYCQFNLEVQQMFESTKQLFFQKIKSRKITCAPTRAWNNTDERSHRSTVPRCVWKRDGGDCFETDAIHFCSTRSFFLPGRLKAVMYLVQSLIYWSRMKLITGNRSSNVGIN